LCCNILQHSLFCVQISGVISYFFPHIGVIYYRQKTGLEKWVMCEKTFPRRFVIWIRNWRCKVAILVEVAKNWYWIRLVVTIGTEQFWTSNQWYLCLYWFLLPSIVKSQDGFCFIKKILLTTHIYLYLYRTCYIFKHALDEQYLDHICIYATYINHNRTHI